MDNDQFEFIQTQLREGFSGMNLRLDRLNSKVADHGEAIAVLEDRSDRSERQSGIISVIVSGITSGVIFGVKALFGK